jgi:hypothetical protein
MAQMALSWLLERRPCHLRIDRRKPSGQLEENVLALNNLTFSEHELAQIDKHVADGELNLWQASSISKNDGAQFPFFITIQVVYRHKEKNSPIYPGIDALSEGNSRYPAFYPR